MYHVYKERRILLALTSNRGLIAYAFDMARETSPFLSQAEWIDRVIKPHANIGAFDTIGCLVDWQSKNGINK